MSTRVLFAAGEETVAAGSRMTLDPRRSHHLVRVLRLGVGDAVEAFDGRGRSHAARLATADPRACVLELGEALACAPDVESPLRITLAQCLSSAERMDWTIEKAVELGVDMIVPLASARSQRRVDAARAARKLEHWQRIVESACTQSGRCRLPDLATPEALEPYLARVGASTRATPNREPLAAGAAQLPGVPDDQPPRHRLLVLDPRADLRLSQARITADRPLVLLIGPESGLSEAELAAALDAGFEAVGLGPRVLRTETAGLAAIAALQALAGDF